MIKAEIIHSAALTEHIVMGAVKFEAKGKHHELVTELRTIINTFNENENYHLELMEIIKELLEQNLDDVSKELDKLKKENK